MDKTNEEGGSEMPTEEKDYITKAELARRIERSQATVQRMMRRGLPYIRYYRDVVMFSWEDCVAWLNEQHYAPPSIIERWRQDAHRKAAG